MKELIWFNGRVTPLSEATLEIEDRGAQFADGVYEVMRVYSGVPFTLSDHLERLARSAEGIRVSMPMGVGELAGEVKSLLKASGMRDGMIYLQLSRGVSPRNHVFAENLPAAGRGKRATPTLYFYNRALPPVPAPGTAPGAKLVTVEDERWKRCWIKSIALLPNVLAKNRAVEAGCDEAVFVENGVVTECCASNLFAVVAAKGGTLVTHPVGPKVLPGITRAVLLEIASKLGIATSETTLTVEQAKSARELFITSTTREISWVSHWDGEEVAGGEPGPVTMKLHRALLERIRAETSELAGV